MREGDLAKRENFYTDVLEELFRQRHNRPLTWARVTSKMDMPPGPHGGRSVKLLLLTDDDAHRVTPAVLAHGYRLTREDPSMADARAARRANDPKAVSMADVSHLLWVALQDSSL